VRNVLVAALVSLIVSLAGTPIAIRALKAKGYGKLIRQDGPTTHHVKRGTPTMGGLVIIAATLTGYLAAHLVFLRGVTASGVLVLMLMTGLGLVGFLDDYIQVRKQRSLGLTAAAKFAGQAVVAIAFGLLATHFSNTHGFTPASSHLSFTRDYSLDFTAAGFVVWAYFMVTATSNGVNLTDGLDGLVAGASCMVFGAYVVIAFWQNGNNCAFDHSNACYAVRDPLDVTLVAAAALGACLGFLWWNTSPARIFMGDTGSLALGGLLSGLAIVTRTELLLVVLGGLFVAVTLSVVIQVAFFRATRRRVFRMAPLHHHFELAGWTENTVIVRFWLVTAMAVAFGIGLFYADWLDFVGL
jgi:phospho-N-acetylmuramoyl-pentapeptide-transferase